ncbi:MAG: type II toxin-antitoxin system Phd/YefM family antitoxin [Nitrospiraceae bacterium]
MPVVGVRELKNRLSRYLKRVQAGEELIVTERRRTVARIVPARTSEIHCCGYLSACIRGSEGRVCPRPSEARLTSQAYRYVVDGFTGLEPFCHCRSHPCAGERSRPTD